MSSHKERDGNPEDGNAILWSGNRAVLVYIPEGGLSEYQAGLSTHERIQVPLLDVDRGDSTSIDVDKIWIVGKPPQI
jgi:hypothetical protein